MIALVQLVLLDTQDDDEVMTTIIRAISSQDLVSRHTSNQHEIDGIAEQ